ncbi:MAG: 4Fe-4S cluster-binding domain-containing protein [Bacteroidales bacterium]|jgi:KamA family protein|nr:4Fe-4S cluster-binding domain-containing protein [Bacteroidales bacterium]
MGFEHNYKVYSLHNFKKIPQIEKYLTKEQIFDIEIVGNILPFKANNYVVDQLINWDNVPNDPIFILTFPQKDMLKPEHYKMMRKAILNEATKSEIKRLANKIRLELNPHPAGQEHNVPEVEGHKLTGIQHKYDQTMLFFPTQGQTCHAYCTFCFRWPQFTGMEELKFAMKETELMIKYLKQNPQITDVLFTGGDPMVMSAKRLRAYIEAILNEVPTVQNIRIGTKSLTYWPYRYLTDKDSQDILDLFKMVSDSGVHLAIMAHFNHVNELQTEAVEDAISAIRKTGAQIRTQSPLLAHINDDPDVWRDMWKRQVELGCVPYYFFMARDTGAKEYFAVSLEDAWEIFRTAYQQVSGLARTVRGPSMSAGPGKIHMLGVTEINGEPVYMLRFLQGRNADWVHRPFFAKYDPKATWIDELEPAFGEKQFFFEKEYAMK